MRLTPAGIGPLLIGFALSTPALAGPIQLTDRSSLTSQTIDWTTYGAPGTTVSTPYAERAGGLTAQIGSSAGIAEIRQEGTDFNGNFAAGDGLLSLPDGYKSDVFGVSFSGVSVYGVGTQIEPVSGFSGAFTAYMDMFSASNALLGEISASGDATAAEDDSAVFLGASSTIPIAYIRFFVSESNAFFPREGDLAINELSLNETVIPEPPALPLFASGVLAAFLAMTVGRKWRPGGDVILHG